MVSVGPKEQAAVEHQGMLGAVVQPVKAILVVLEQLQALI
jgi:hypothetical protein